MNAQDSQSSDVLVTCSQTTFLRKTSQSPTMDEIALYPPEFHSFQSQSHHRKVSISLFFFLFVPVCALTVALLTPAWITVNRSAENSTNILSNRFHSFIVVELKSRILSIIQGMLNTIEVTHASVSSTGVNVSSMNSMEKFFFRMIHEKIGPTTVSYVDATGWMVGAHRLNEVITIAECLNSSFNNGTVMKRWIADDSGGKTRLITNIPYNPLKQPWYVDVIAKNTTTYTPPFMYPDGIEASTFFISLSKPFFDSMGTITGAVSAHYLSDAVEQVLQDAYVGLGATGTLLLFNTQDYSVMASQPADFDSVEVAKLQQLMKAGMLDSYSTPNSIVAQIDFTSSITSVAALSWKLVAIIETDGLYSPIYEANRTAVILMVVFIVGIFVLSIILYRVILVLPLQRLRQTFQSLKSSLDKDEYPINYQASTTTSMFSEIRLLYDSAISTMIAVDRLVKAQMHQRLKIQELQHKDELQSQNIKAKELFFAMMSHELRTPLTAVIGMAEVLRDSTLLDSKQENCVGAILLSGKLMHSLVNNLLDYSKLEAQKLVLESEPFNLREIIDSAAETIEVKAEEKHVELIIDLSSNIQAKCICLGDGARLGQVLLNLLSNAIKFTHQGTIFLRVLLDSEMQFLTFEVEDTGIGIPESSRGNIFQAFSQADTSMTRRYGGTGLGLVISQRLVRQMGGKLDYRSLGENQGCVFYFTVPFRQVTNDIEPSHIISLVEEDLTSHPSPIAIVDSNSSRANALCSLLQAIQLRFFTFSSLQQLSQETYAYAASQCSLIIAHRAELRYEADVISVLQRRGFGEGKLRKIIFIVPLREMQQALPTVSSCNLSSSSTAMTTTSTTTNNTLMVDIIKPISISKLRVAFRTLFCSTVAATSRSISESASENLSIVRAATTATTTTTTTHASTSPARVLIVDDVELNRFVLSHKLEQNNFRRIEVACSGTEALEKITKATDWVYDIILMDVMMPDMDGYECTKRIKSLPRYAAVPIIGVTGNTMKSDLQRCEESGMCSVVTKPIDTTRLITLIQFHLSSKNTV